MFDSRCSATFLAAKATQKTASTMPSDEACPAVFSVPAESPATVTIDADVGTSTTMAITLNNVSAMAATGTLTVSLDGGRNWRTAKIDGPVWDKALTRFYYEFDWDGSELLLQSRAMDESGYVQPSKAELRKYRGVNSIYHNNGIQTWHLHKNGEVENVEIG